MAVVLRMPEVIANAESAVLTQWVLSQGDSFATGDVLAEIETEKALVELSAESDGVLWRTLVEPGTTVLVGDPIAVITSPGESEGDAELALGRAVNSKPIPANDPQGNSAEELFDVAVQVDDVSDGIRRFSSPLARRLARENDIDISVIRGTGPGERVMRRDIESAIARQVAGQLEVTVQRHVAKSGDEAPDSEYVVIPHTPMRLAIAHRLTESKSNIPHFYVRGECVVDELMALRSQFNETATTRVSINDLIVKAVSIAHAKVPALNVTWTENDLRQHLHSDVGMAIAIPGGLVTPVLRRVDELRVTDIARATRDLAERARSRRLMQSEIEGGSFAVTNMGMLGVLEFSAIINPPQSGILAVGAIRPIVVPVDGNVQVSSAVNFTLSVDHRCVDGVAAAQWMSTFVETIERPLGLFV